MLEKSRAGRKAKMVVGSKKLIFREAGKIVFWAVLPLAESGSSEALIVDEAASHLPGDTLLCNSPHKLVGAAAAQDLRGDRSKELEQWKPKC